mgnify:CR=1 FL=1
MMVIENGRVVTETEVLENCSVIVQDDRIVELLTNGRVFRSADSETVVDAAGGYILPGFIDIHSDYIETVTSPRSTALMDFSISLHEVQRMLMMHGVTTIFHSLSMLDTDLFDPKPIRRNENVGQMITSISKEKISGQWIHNKLHLRFEIDSVGKVADLRSYLESGMVDLLSFMNHRPGQGQYRDPAVFLKAIQEYIKISGDQAELVEQFTADGMNGDVLTWESIRELVDLAHKNGTAVASHDDDTLEKVCLIHDLGINISEFPITLEVAKKAKDLGMMTVGGSPNILLGKSHSGNLSMTEAILADTIDILCSDYYPAALLQSVFKLVHEFNLPLPEMVGKVSLNPAKAVGMDQDTGSLQPGKKADLLIVREIDRIPYVASCFVDGNLLFQSSSRIKKGVVL